MKKDECEDCQRDGGVQQLVSIVPPVCCLLRVRVDYQIVAQEFNSFH